MRKPKLHAVEMMAERISGRVEDLERQLAKDKEVIAKQIERIGQLEAVVQMIIDWSEAPGGTPDVILESAS